MAYFSEFMNQAADTVPDSTTVSVPISPMSRSSVMLEEILEEKGKERGGEGEGKEKERERERDERKEKERERKNKRKGEEV